MPTESRETRHAPTPADIKKQARRIATDNRRQAHQSLKDSAPGILAETGLGFLDISGGTISGFYPYLSEIDPLPLLQTLAAAGWKTALPVVVAKAKPLIFRQWTPYQPTIAGCWDIPIPPQTAPELIPDVLLVPMLAFDSQGYRLGYGGGFYDRTLAKLRREKPVTAIGVAYSAQQIDAVPRQPHDQPLDWLLTETGARRPQAEA